MVGRKPQARLRRLLWRGKQELETCGNEALFASIVDDEAQQSAPAPGKEIHAAKIRQRWRGGNLGIMGRIAAYVIRLSRRGRTIQMRLEAKLQAARMRNNSPAKR
jgi:hypothetical protein